MVCRPNGSVDPSRHPARNRVGNRRRCAQTRVKSAGSRVGDGCRKRVGCFRRSLNTRVDGRPHACCRIRQRRRHRVSSRRQRLGDTSRNSICAPNGRLDSRLSGLPDRSTETRRNLVHRRVACCPRNCIHGLGGSQADGGRDGGDGTDGSSDGCSDGSGNGDLNLSGSRGRDLGSWWNDRGGHLNWSRGRSGSGCSDGSGRLNRGGRLGRNRRLSGLSGLNGSRGRSSGGGHGKDTGRTVIKIASLAPVERERNKGLLRTLNLSSERDNLPSCLASPRLSNQPVMSLPLRPPQMTLVAIKVRRNSRPDHRMARRVNSNGAAVWAQIRVAGCAASVGFPFWTLGRALVAGVVGVDCHELHCVAFRIDGGDELGSGGGGDGRGASGRCHFCYGRATASETSNQSNSSNQLLSQFKRFKSAPSSPSDDAMDESWQGFCSGDDEDPESQTRLIVPPHVKVTSMDS